MKNANPRKCSVAVCAILLGAGVVWAEDWPQWRGPNRDAKVTGFVAPKTWPKELTKKWTVKVGDGVATPALVGDKLYVFSREGNDEIIRCLNAGTGEKIWEDKSPAPGVRGPDSGYPGPRCSPTVAEGKVVTLGVGGTLSCFDAATGKKLWRNEDFKGEVPQFHTASSPVVVDGLCIAQVGSADDGGVFAFDMATGKKKWGWTENGPAYASPALMTVDGAKLVIAETRAKMVALNVADGKLAWQTPFSTRYNAASPIVDGQTLICAGQGKGATAYHFEKKGDGFVAKELWKNSEKSVMYNTPVVKDGMLYGITDRNDFFCINAQSGKTAWSVASAKSGAPAGGPPPAGGSPPAGGQPKGKGGGRGGMGGMRGPLQGAGSIVDAGSVLVALIPSSQLVVFEPSDKAFTEIARIKVASSPTYAYPVLVDNRLFVKDQDSVTLYTVQ